jgi:hypothetical protein
MLRRASGSRGREYGVIPGAIRRKSGVYGDPVMEKPSIEKRRDARFSCGSPVEWAYLNKSEKHDARMRNFSEAGASFESSRAPVEGATILVRIEAYLADCRSDCPEESSCPWPRSMVLGEVKWCRDISGSGLPLFGVGVKYHLPV